MHHVFVLQLHLHLRRDAIFLLEDLHYIQQLALVNYSKRIITIEAHLQKHLEK